MKKILLFFLLIFSVSLSAQCKDGFPKDNSWKFATGVTLFSNNHYVSDINVLERQPLEFNLRYKIKNHHVLRFGIPILYKVNKSGNPTASQYPIGEVSLKNYLETLHNQDYDYAYYHKTLDFYESLYGASVGYDYDFRLCESLSLFAGFNLAYYYSATDSKYYTISYYGLDENQMSKIGLISFWKEHFYRNATAIHPVLGIRYLYQKLLVEANIGYVFTTQNVSLKSDYSSIEGISGITGNESKFYNVGTYQHKNLLYNLSLYYSF